ncbi:hypothetical protein BDN70DRAFT_617100 [Pholiota conissans]|uniref:Uncharacterized protein n=1 Tax=Pholiota conissans TaxID=109636 RepID=A0A9P6CLS5_9AGAR|nr:hypothetical protein BDN70DRAFT_617100 [Pholiota conissans]
MCTPESLPSIAWCPPPYYSAVLLRNAPSLSNSRLQDQGVLRLRARFSLSFIAHPRRIFSLFALCVSVSFVSQRNFLRYTYASTILYPSTFQGSLPSDLASSNKMALDLSLYHLRLICSWTLTTRRPVISTLGNMLELRDRPSIVI